MFSLWSFRRTKLPDLSWVSFQISFLHRTKNHHKRGKSIAPKNFTPESSCGGCRSYRTEELRWRAEAIELDLRSALVWGNGPGRDFKKRVHLKRSIERNQSLVRNIRKVNLYVFYLENKWVDVCIGNQREWMHDMKTIIRFNDMKPSIFIFTRQLKSAATKKNQYTTSWNPTVISQSSYSTNLVQT